MSETPDRWVSGDAYENFMGRWSRRMAKEFIRWLAPTPGWRWLEVGCGTGALTAAICEDASPGAVVACDPSAQFVSYARRAFSHPALTFQVAGDGDLPRAAGGYDAAVAGLVLNFIPNPAEATVEMVRRLRPGGMLAGYVWDYSAGMQALIAEGDEMIQQASNSITRDAALIAAAQRVEHYEMAGYGTVVSYAHQLDRSSVADLLQQSLNEEKQADLLLSQIAEAKVNAKVL